MRLRRGTLPDVVLTVGLYLLRRRIRAKIESFTSRGRNAYQTVSHRLDRPSRPIRRDDQSPFSPTGSLLLGVGVGVAVGLLIAPVRGAKTRGNIAERVEDLGKGSEPRPAGQSEVSFP
jgi:hypothetical protein